MKVLAAAAAPVASPAAWPGAAAAAGVDGLVGLEPGAVVAAAAGLCGCKAWVQGMGREAGR